jgi:hypothetical protein
MGHYFRDSTRPEVENFLLTRPDPRFRVVFDQ